MEVTLTACWDVSNLTRCSDLDPGNGLGQVQPRGNVPRSQAQPIPSTQPVHPQLPRSKASAGPSPSPPGCRAEGQGAGLAHR